MMLKYRQKPEELVSGHGVVEYLTETGGSQYVGLWNLHDYLAIAFLMWYIKVILFQFSFRFSSFSPCDVSAGKGLYVFPSRNLLKLISYEDTLFYQDSIRTS